MKFIDLNAQYQHLKINIDASIQNVLDHGQYIMGPEVDELEESLANFVGVKHCITCANGTDALTLALLALEIEEGDAVFCPTFTFFATAEAIALRGATPVFVDSDQSTFNICPKHLEYQIQKIQSEGLLKPVAIIPVDLFGLPANYPEIEKIATQYDLKIIEDAAQGLGGEINGRKAGSFGDIGTTSFFPAKPLGCYGDGGALFTDSDQYAELLRSLRIHGKGADKYDNIRIGMNSRLDTIQAAILIEKLKIFPEELIKRDSIAKQYNDQFLNTYETPSIPEGYISAWAQYTLLSDDRRLAIQKFKNDNIPTMIYYKTCMHQQSAFKDLQYTDKDFPIATMLTKKVFSLPMHPYLNMN